MSSDGNSFADLDRSAGIDPPSEQIGEEMPLPAWHRSIYCTPINEFGIEDLSKATRQRLHPEAVVPVVIARLRENPLVGEFFDGELLVSLRSVDPTFWFTHGHLARSAWEIVNGAWEDIPDDVKSDAKELLRVLEELPSLRR